MADPTVDMALEDATVATVVTVADPTVDTEVTSVDMEDATVDMEVATGTVDMEDTTEDMEDPLTTVMTLMLALVLLERPRYNQVGVDSPSCFLIVWRGF